MLSPVLIVLFLIVLLMWVAVALIYGRSLHALWREPVLRHPVCIVESDDWGPGEASHAGALSRIREVLLRHRDVEGRPACMTIGVLLAVPDCAAIAKADGSAYARQTLLDPRHAPIRETLQAGERTGCFALQLHGMEHIWPASLMNAVLIEDPEVSGWLRDGVGWHTEALPSALQSRWVDGSVLPSRGLDASDIKLAVDEETSLFEQVFGCVPRVVVPPTFVWNATVERAWAAKGVNVVITPGRRLTGRDAQGRPAMSDRSILNAQKGDGGVIYLVRDVYFEPALGHRAATVVPEIAQRFALGRPALLETHRFNFVRSEAECTLSLNELDALFGQVRDSWPDLRFMSSERLVGLLTAEDSVLLENRLARRLTIWLRRARGLPGMRKALLFSGLFLPVWLLSRILDTLSPATTNTLDGVST